MRNGAVPQIAAAAPPRANRSAHDFDADTFTSTFTARLGQTNWEDVGQREVEIISNDPWTYGPYDPMQCLKAEMARLAKSACDEEGVPITTTNIGQVLAAMNAAVKSKQSPTLLRAAMSQYPDAMASESTTAAAQILLAAISRVPGYQSISIEDLPSLVIDPLVLDSLSLRSNPLALALYNGNDGSGTRYDLHMAQGWQTITDPAWTDAPSTALYLRLRNTVIPSDRDDDIYGHVQQDEGVRQTTEYKSHSTHATASSETAFDAMLKSHGIHRSRRDVLDAPFHVAHGVDYRENVMHGSTQAFASAMAAFTNEFERSRASIANRVQGSDQDRVAATRLAIVTLCQQLVKLHPLTNANYRVFGVLLKNYLLLRSGLSLHISKSGLHFEGRLPQDDVADMEAADAQRAGTRASN